MHQKLTKNEIVGICREVLVKEGLHPRAHDHMVARFAEGWDGGRSRRRVVDLFRAQVRGYGR